MTEIFRMRRILVPYDGSDASEAAFVYATQIPCDEIVLLHVDVADELIVPEWGEADEDEVSLHAVMERLAKRFTTDRRTVRVEYRAGDVADEVIKAGVDVDLIVMMTHGRGTAGRVLFGSVADRVVRHGETPTLLLRMGDLTREPEAPKRVVVALDGSELAERAVLVAEAVGRLLNVPVVLMRAVTFDDVQRHMRALREPGKAPYEQSSTLHEDAKRAAIKEASAYLGHQAKELQSAGLEVEERILDGSPAFVLLWELAPDDLLVMTTRGQGGFKRWSIGSVAEKLVREAPCPILLQRGGK
ncbi:MAG TPA: universal stress protein [Thermomicrobiales bacterium]|nr:universal stress protein [Thermomicrobiales bacterium]